ncbi:MAG: hypothetical protein ACI84R_002599 [Candidatus Azotimanducaceae bacterium]|jgi:hypothetical protein
MLFSETLISQNTGQNLTESPFPSKLFSEHLETPEITIDDHVRKSSIALGEHLSSRKPVYLDMNYWIWLRDSQRISKPTKASILFDLLQHGVRTKKIYCPISHSTFIELLKQTDQSSRLLTADLVDELSLGVAFAEENVRLSTEFAHLMYEHSGFTDLHPIKNLVWTKLSYVLGVMHPSNTPFDNDTELAIQKAFFDHMCTLPLRDILEVIGGNHLPELNLGRTAQNVNDGNCAHSHEIRSFNQAYAAEIRGVFDISLDELPDLIVDIARKNGTPVTSPNDLQRRATRAYYRELFSQALEKNKERDRLRTAHIFACLHASLRWNKTRKYKANDIFDFHHAVAALAYCDVFLTEKSLKTTVEQKHLQLDNLYGCKVAANMDEAISILQEIVD